MSKKVKDKKNFIQITTIIVIIITVISIVLWTGIYIINYAVIGEDEVVNQEGKDTNSVSTSKKKIINALVCGKNQELTDTIIYVTLKQEKSL